MELIYINSYPQNFLPTFLLILPHKWFYKEGEEYVFNEWYNKEYLFKKYLVSKKTLPFSDITDEHTYLAKNCDSKLFYQIVKTQYKSRLTQYKLDLIPSDIRDNYKVGSLYSFINKETLMDIMVFTDKACIKSIVNEDLKKYASKIPDTSKSLLSGKSINLKGYCHESKWFSERGRPYTDDELLELERNGKIIITDKCVTWVNRSEE